MIPLPETAERVLRTLREAGYQGYAVGGCVRDALCGRESHDFDLATDAPFAELCRLFPEAQVLSEKLSVLRFAGSNAENGSGCAAEYARNGAAEDAPVCTVDLATLRIDGAYSDHRRPDEVRFTDKIEDDLARRDFTINAMAASGGSEEGKEPLDPYGGRADLAARLIRTVGEAEARFREDPIRMMRAARFAAQLGFSLERDTARAMRACAPLLVKAGRDALRGEFEKLLTAEHTGRGLYILHDGGLLPYLLDETGEARLSRGEERRFAALAAGVDRTYRVRERRLGVFFGCFERKKAEAAVRSLHFDKKTTALLHDAICLPESVAFLTKAEVLKDFLARYGRERYEYLHNLAKADCLIYGTPDFRVRGRIALMKQIEADGDPIYVEDLAISGRDLIEEGLATGEEVGATLLMLTDFVHRRPRENTREALLLQARRFQKSRMATALRNRKWIR